MDSGFADITTSSRDRLVPANPEAEQAVLGSILIDPDAVIRVAAFLKTDDFYQEKNGWIYQAILDLHERREPADFLTVTDELDRRRQLDEVGGPAYVMDLINAVPTAIHVEHYARIVERTSVLRKLIRAAGQIAQIAYEETTEDIGEVVDRAEQIVFSVAERRAQRDLVAVRTLMGDVVDRIDFLYHHRGEILGVPTGFKLLDKMLGGLQKSDLVILAARPGVGKTSLAISLAQNAARKYGKRVAVFSLEMSNEQLVQRMLSAETGIDSQRLRLGDIQGEEEWHRLMEAAGALSDAPIFIDDTPAVSAMELRTKARRLYAEHDLDLIVVDYLQLMQGDRRSENRVQEISAISRGLKGLARELNVPVLALSQLSRAVETRQDKRPILSDLRESGCLSGDSLVVLADTGERVPMSQLVGKSGFRIWALNENTFKIEPAEVSRAFSTGIKPVHRLVTGLGREIRATSNHTFRTLGGWMRLDQLRVGDRVALPRIIPAHGGSTPIPTAEAALLGHLIGDGCTLPRHAIQYTTRECDLAEEVMKLSSQVFGSRLQPRIKQERQWYQVYLSAADHLTHGVRNPVAAWLSNLGVFGLRSYEKRVPDAIFQQPNETIAVFLRHLWATDGCIRPPGTHRRHPTLYYATSSPELARDVQSLLLRSGVNAVLKTRKQGNKGRTQYHVLIMGRTDILNFADTIGAVGEYKIASLAECRQWCESRAANTNRDIIPREVWRTVAIPAMQRNAITTRQMQKALGSAYSGTGLYKQNVSRERAHRLASAVGGDERLMNLASSDVYWDDVVAIEFTDEEEVFDLTVPGHNNFVANDIIVHNSIEQDADVVMFIYREEMYNEETDKQNIADVIIAKHRNGPTGSVSLFFRKELTQFRDLEMRREELE